LFTSFPFPNFVAGAQPSPDEEKKR